MTDEHHLPRLNALCESIGDVIAGQAAQELLASRARPSTGSLIILPSWVWRIPIIDVGRKGRSATGELHTMPARIVWDGSPVHVLRPRQKLQIGWRITGLGHGELGTSLIHINGGYGVQIKPEPNQHMTPVRRPFGSYHAFQKCVGAVVESGNEARWRIIASLELFTKSKLARANSTVAAELGEYHKYAISSVLDDIGLDDLLSQMLYGDGGSSVISRLVDRGLKPDTFNRVDPMHYFSASIRARAEEAIRRRIGDPKVGPKVRRIFMKTNAKSIDELLTAYRKVYPKDSLARKRAIAALTSGSDAMVHSKFLYEETTRAPEVIE